MSTEILFTHHSGKGIGAKVEIHHGQMTPDDYPKLYAAFARAAGIRSPDYVIMKTLYPDRVKDDVWWSEDLCYDGCRFTLFVEPQVSRDDYLSVRRWLQKERDVKSFKTCRIDRWVNLTYTPTCQP